MKRKKSFSQEELRYLKLLAQQYPTVQAASSEIINLQAILNLPKGTEHFISDVHGEYEAFLHILNSCSGVIKEKVDDLFAATISRSDRDELCTLIYYPEEKLEQLHQLLPDMDEWYRITLHRLIEICRWVSSKYTRSKVRKALPKDYAYIIDELLHTHYDEADKRDYYENIINTIIDLGQADRFIEAVSLVIKRMAVDHMHIVGDIFDRGPRADIIMDSLLEYHSVDIQWGNHDIVWMGAALGQRGCIAHVVRNCARYGNLSILEDAYGINILPLAAFATSAYADDPCVAFGLKGNPDLPPQELEMNVKIQKAMAIIQFKVEAQLIDENPGFGLADRKLLDKIDHERGTVMLDGVEYALTDTVFPTVNPDDPYRLTPEEEEVMQRLEQAFTGCEKLQRHMRFFLEAGSLYKVYNGSLLFHACVPLNADGSLMETEVFGETYKGRALYDVMERYVRAAFDDANPELAKRGRDLLWYMWLGEGSPLFAKSKMATFELYLIAEKEARKEVKNPFYTYLDDERVMAGVFEDFGMDPETSRIVCGHIPVKVKDGEDPVKCGGKLLIIDGGFSKAYQPKTGIAGYTLIYNSYGLVLAAHEPFESVEKAVSDGNDIVSHTILVQHVVRRKTVADTDNGKVMRENIRDLENLLRAYREGTIVENP